MSTFPYAFPKQLLLNGTVKTTGNSWDLAAGEFGLYDKNTNAVVTTGNVASHPYVYAAQGSYYTVDTVGNTPLGRLKESRKTQGINAKYVTKFYKQPAVVAAPHIIKIGSVANALNFQSDKTYNLRVETKGSQALRVLNRHMYKNVPFFTGCVADATVAVEYVDPASVLKGWADYINADPLLKIFVAASAYKQTLATTQTNSAADAVVVVADATGIAAGQLVQGVGVSPETYVVSVAGTSITLSKATAIIAPGTAVTFNTLIDDTYVPVANSATAPTDVAFLVLKGGYTDTTFTDCSFNPYDFVQVEPLIIYASIVDGEGNPCSTGPKANSNVGENASEIQAPVQKQGIGENVLRDLILSLEYDGIHFNTDPRKREVESNPVLSSITRANLYNRYYIQFHVPTHANPNNTMASNQYLVGFSFDSSIDTSAFETLISDWLAANNPTVSLQTI